MGTLLEDAQGYIGDFPKEVVAPDVPKGRAVFIFDTSWVGYAAAYAYSRLGISREGEFLSTGILFGLLRAIQYCKRNFKNSLVVLALDSKPTKNLERVESYKEGRPADRPEVHSTLAMALPYVSRIPGVLLLKEPGAEADDLIHSFIVKFKPEGTTYVYTTDSNIYQVINDNVFLFSHWQRGVPQIVTKEDCVEKYDVPPQAIPMYRAIIGKPSDNVRGIVDRFPRDIARDIALRFSRVDDFVDNFGSLLVPSDSPSSARFRYLHTLLEKKEDLAQRLELFTLDTYDVQPYRYNVPEDLLHEFADFFQLGTYKSLIGWLYDGPRRSNGKQHFHSRSR